MLKTLDMALIRCPVGFSEELVAIFKMKMSQIDTENDKNHKVFQFSKILLIFINIFDSFRQL